MIITGSRWVGIAALGWLMGCGASAGPDGSRRGSARPTGPVSPGDCAAPVVAWAERCAARGGIEIPAVQCPEAQIALLDLGGEPGLRVELGRADPRSFRRVGEWGLSPMGSFADWSRVDARLRHRFDRVTECVRADAGFAQGFGAAGRGRRERAAPGGREHGSLGAPRVLDSVPWLMLGALACVLGALRGAWRTAACRRRAALGGAVALGAFALRWPWFPGRFFHQNGQGPLWVAVTVSPQHHPYGPGYRALFGWLRWFTRDPDRGVFFAQGVLACLGPPCALLLARRLGARPPLAWALAAAVAVDPILGRLSRSESYYGVGASLLFIAAALLASSLTSLRLRSAGFLLPVLAAALVIAQHALVHPVGWLAAALTPAVLLLGPGHWRRRARRTAVATLIIAVVVALVAGPTLLSVLRSPFAGHWMGSEPQGFPGLAAVGRVTRSPPLALAMLAAVAATALSARSLVRGALQALVMVVALAALLLADLVGFGVCMAWVHQAYLRLYAPVAVALAAVTLQPLPRSRPQGLALGLGVALVAALVAWRAWPAWTKLPTDASEQELVRRWRGELPAAGRVAYLERVGQRLLVLPLYQDTPRVGPAPLLLRGGEPVDDLTRQGRAMYYVRTSLCTTPEGREFCAQVERRYRLERVREVELPAVPSMVGLGYDRPTVRVGLYRVTGTIPGPHAGLGAPLLAR